MDLGSRWMWVVLVAGPLGWPVGASAQQISLDARLGQPVLLAGRKQTTYLKVGLRGFALARQADRPPVNVAIVLDKSGSMAGPKIIRAKAAAQMAVDRLGPEDIVSVIAYDNRVRVLVPATKVRDRAQIRRGISRLSSGGNTALFAGVSKGADELRKFLDPNRVNRIILLSDGLANVGPSSPGELARLGAALGREGITVTTLGLGLDYNEDLMARLARASDGNHAFIEGASDLARFFNLEFGDVLSVVAQDVHVRVRCGPGVRPIRVLGRDADIVGQEVTASISQLHSGGEKFVMLEVEVAPGEAGGQTPIAEVSVSYSNMITQATDTLTASVRATRTADRAEVRRGANRDVMVRAIELVANEKNQHAVSLRDEGRVREAAALLNDNARWLDHNARTWGARELNVLGTANRSDAANLAPQKWNKQRKKMRRLQHKLDLQQMY